SGGLPLAARAAALSRTRARTLNPRTGILPTREIKRLYTAAVDAAERLIYIENQYFASEILFDALRRRLRDRSRTRLQIILLYPLKMRTPYEGLCLGLAQARMFRDIRQEADDWGHNLGLYYTVTPGPGGTETPVYIHSKVMAVDDRFLTVGSANTTDRSLRLDTELNWSWEAPSSETELGRSIRAARVDLLAEHCGIGEEETEERKALEEPEGLVARLDALAAEKNRRLRKRETDPYTQDRGLLTSLKPRDLLLDPGKAVIEEALAGRGFTSWKEIF
ncbi:MAG: phospholipase D-like domain-containing protein, partial [Elusimicrobiota bacterium]